MLCEDQRYDDPEMFHAALWRWKLNADGASSTGIGGNWHDECSSSFFSSASGSERFQ